MTDAHGVARDQLRAFIERIERLEEEKKSIADDIKDVYGEAKGTGFDTKILREVIKIRKQDRDERAEREAILDSYLIALGMIEQPSFFDDEPRQSIPASREERRRQLSEDMAEHKNLVDEMADAGLISEEARHENKALADAVATKFGNGPAMPLRSDGGLSILTKHEDIRTAPVTAEEITRPAHPAVSGGEPSIPSTDAGGVKMDGTSHPGRPDATTSGLISAKSERATNTISPEEAEEEFPSAERDDRAAANAGGDDVDGGALRAKPLVTGGGAPKTALPTNGVTMEYVPASGVKRLPFAHCFPELSKADYDRLERDIAANRVQTPIIRRDDVIIDGWARYMISRQYGMSYPVVEYTGCDILLDVIEWQRASRNFTQAQEKKIAAGLAKAMPDRADDIMAAFGLAEALEAAE